MGLVLCPMQAEEAVEGVEDRQGRGDYEGSSASKEASKPVVLEKKDAQWVAPHIVEAEKTKKLAEMEATMTKEQLEEEKKKMAHPMYADEDAGWGPEGRGRGRGRGRSTRGGRGGPRGASEGRGSYQSQSYQAAVGGGFGFNTYSGGTGGWGGANAYAPAYRGGRGGGRSAGRYPGRGGGEEIHLHLAVIIVLWVMEGSTGPLVREDKKNKKK